MSHESKKEKIYFRVQRGEGRSRTVRCNRGWRVAETSRAAEEPLKISTTGKIKSPKSLVRSKMMKELEVKLKK